ncbi:DDE_superfamily endonuclease domain containing protein [Hexamita inflata]|uniref:DDE_superfamily endonuclease domain containing protein n=1 Tax=Hexamita inflata TaxID=28002 RepID=A0ABP1MWV9_9EUKA
MLLQNYGVNNYVWVSQMLSFIVGIIFVRCEVEILTSLTLFRFNKINNIKQTSQLNQSSTAYLLKQLFNQQHNLKLQQDNAPTHFSKYMKNFYTANNIELYRFPVMSPDLNPLFHCWNPLKSNISPEECTTYDLLNEEVKRALEQISLDIINHLIDSMPKRLEEVIKQKGDATKH